MKLQKTLDLLKTKGTEKNRSIYARHGYPKDTFGVSFADLKVVTKTIGVDGELARSLWKTGNGDARVLAVMIADPGQMSVKELDMWVREIRFYVLADMFSHLAGRSASARELSDKWRGDSSDHIAQVGWNLLGTLSAGIAFSDKELGLVLDEIEKTIHARPNRTRHAMNMALCAIGGARESLRVRALDVAKSIGTVLVDHGETGCKTPDAEVYIGKIANHLAEKAKGSQKKALKKAALEKTPKKKALKDTTPTKKQFAKNTGKQKKVN